MKHAIAAALYGFYAGIAIGAQFPLLDAGRHPLSLWLFLASGAFALAAAVWELRQLWRVRNRVDAGDV
jgi:hypothetical protein